MTLNSKIVHDPPAARQFRLLAPLVVLLVLAALLMMPGILAERGDKAAVGAARPQAQDDPAPRPFGT
jgi:hypothetical protein